MDPKRSSLKEKMINHDHCIVEDDLEDDMEELEDHQIQGDHDKKRGSVGNNGMTTYGKRGISTNYGGGGGGGGGCGGMSSPPSCQVERCGADLSDAKRYHRRHKVCEVHSKSPAVVVGGLRQRFCQQCSRFHELSEFDEAKRSCRRRLAGHNERRRKGSAESSGEGSTRKGMSTQLKECRAADERGRLQMTLPGNPTYKRSQIQ